MRKSNLKKTEIDISKDNLHRLKNIIDTIGKSKVPLLDIHFNVNSPPDFIKIKPVLHHLINRFENKTSILFFNLPYCILPDAEEHIINPISDKKTKFPECTKCKFNAFCGGYPEKHRETEVKAARDLPREVSLELITKCNLDCSFCFNKNAYDDDYSLTKEQTFSIIEQAKKMGIKRIRFTGGEPVLDKNLSEYLRYAKKVGLEVWLNTNGFAYEKYSPDILKNLDSMLIPVHGLKLDPEITGNPKSLLNKIRTVNRAKYSKNKIILRAGTVIMTKNLSEIRKIHNLTESLHINWELYRLIGDRENLNLPEDFNKLFEILLKIYHTKNRRFFVTNAFPFCFFDYMDKARLFSLGGFLDDGRDRIVINAKGHAKPAYYSKDNVGNWKDLKRAWKNEIMLNLRTLRYLPNNCKSCVYSPICKGGSRILAKNISGSYHKEDPLISRDQET